MIAHMPTPHLQVVVSSTLWAMLPLTQVLIIKGVAAIYDQSKRDLNELMSATMTSTKKVMMVRPIW